MIVTKYIIFAVFLVALAVPVISQDEGCAHVVDGTATEQSPGVWLIAATVSSTETGWDKYADEWIVSTKNIGNDEMTVLGTRSLAHPHENEQPFTRSLSGVMIPEDVSTVVLSARDSVLGYCGDTYELSLGGTSETEAAVLTTTTLLGNNNTSVLTNTTDNLLESSSSPDSSGLVQVRGFMSSFSSLFLVGVLVASIMAL